MESSDSDGSRERVAVKQNSKVKASNNRNKTKERSDKELNE